MAGVRVVALSRRAPVRRASSRRADRPLRRGRGAGRGGRRRAGALVLLSAAVLSSCGDGRTRVVVRTALDSDTRDRIEAAFEEANPLIDVRFSNRGDDLTLAELREDGEVDFDVWWGGAPESMEVLAREGRLAGWSPWAESPFVFAFDRDRVSLVNAPTEWIDLLHHGWADDVLVPDPDESASGASFVLGALAQAARTDGDAYYGFDWLERVDGQVVRYAPDGDEAIRGVVLGEASLAVVPLVDFQAAVEGDEETTLHHRRPTSRGAAWSSGVGLVEAEGVVAEAAASFVAFVTSTTGLEALENGWEEPDATRGEDAKMMADSLSVWMMRWREDVRGRGL